MLTGRPLRLKHFDYTGPHRYSLTFCTHRRRTLFTVKAGVDLALSQIVRASNEREFAIIVYCFMPDHLHLLVHGLSEQSECKLFISRAKQYSAYHYSKQLHTTLWQRYGYERTLRKEEDTVRVARYILENPVRAGLVANALDYPFSGSMVCDLKSLLDSVGSG